MERLRTSDAHKKVKVVKIIQLVVDSVGVFDGQFYYLWTHQDKRHILSSFFFLSWNSASWANCTYFDPPSGCLCLSLSPVVPADQNWPLGCSGNQTNLTDDIEIPVSVAAGHVRALNSAISTEYKPLLQKTQRKVVGWPSSKWPSAR